MLLVARDARRLAGRLGITAIPFYLLGAGIDERQSVIYSAGSTLALAGLLDESDALITAELKRSHSPYYYMLVLASNAKRQTTPSAPLSTACRVRS